MRKQDKIVVWPVYFDSTKTCAEGRRVPKNLAVPSPKIQEIKDAAEKIGFECEVVADASYPKMPWLKTGMLILKKNEPKTKMLRKVAKQILKTRGMQQPQ
ncbi:MAG: signal recognition particle subunit SRP19/SEC65 family protein [Candidatus Bathyarchaeia archaeon]